MKRPSFSEIQRQKAKRRMAAIRRARRSPEAAAAEQKRASLFGGNAAKWRVTNWKEVARTLAKWS